MIPFALGIVGSILTLGQPHKIGVAAWCTVNKNDATVECNYNMKDDCETYRESDEYCVKNPTPGQEDFQIHTSGLTAH